MQDAQAPGLEVLERVRRRAELGSAGTGEANGDSVDGEVPAPKVIVGAAGAHIGQASGRRIGLAAPRGDVDAPLAPADKRRFEALVRAALQARVGTRTRIGERRGELLREQLGSALDHHVELLGGTREQQVAGRPPDQLGVLPAGHHSQQLSTARDLGQAREHHLAAVARVRGAAVALRVDVWHHAAARTGTPPAARCALVSAMVCHP